MLKTLTGIKKKFPYKLFFIFILLTLCPGNRNKRLQRAMGRVKNTPMAFLYEYKSHGLRNAWLFLLMEDLT